MNQAAGLPSGPSPTRTAPRTPASASNLQRMHPVRASRARTSPNGPATIACPPATAGEVRTCPASGNAKAQRSCSLGTSAASSAAFRGGWKPVPDRFPPNPIHETVPTSRGNHPASAQYAASGKLSSTWARPARYSATQIRCCGDRAAPSARMTPSSSEATMARGDSWLRSPVPGVRSSPAEVWQLAQSSAKMRAPSSRARSPGSCAHDGPGSSNVARPPAIVIAAQILFMD